MNGIIEISTGYLLRAGYCDFEHDGAFCPETEAYRTDVPEPSYVLCSPNDEGQIHKYDDGWELVDAPSCVFMATGKEADIYDTPFRKPNTFGLYEKGEIDEKGDVVLLEMYKDYDVETEEFSNLAVKEMREYTRNDVGIVTKRVINIKWYKQGGELAKREKDFTKYFNAVNGLTQNQKSRTKLANQAGLWLVGDLMTQYGEELGETKAQEFLNSVEGEATTYTNAVDISPLVTAVNDTTYDYMVEDSEQYPEVSRKDVFNSIINITYP